MIFSEDVIAELNQSSRDVSHSVRQFLLQYPCLQLRSARATEFLNQGFLRRFMTLGRCIENIYRLLPPELEEVPSKETRKDAEISIQAFVFNAFGALDNLAWIWVEEANVRRPNGGELSRGQVGLSNRCRIVRASLSDATQRRLVEFDEWFDNLEEFRHSLAHRIPLYIPPFSVAQADEEQHRDYERRMHTALIAENFEENERLRELQAALERFHPLMTHSIGENAPTVVFHAQIIADFNTIQELRDLIFAEIEALHNRQAAQPDV